jgi:hypothetical protein
VTKFYKFVTELRNFLTFKKVKIEKVHTVHTKKSAKLPLTPQNDLKFWFKISFKLLNSKLYSKHILGNSEISLKNVKSEHFVPS